MIRTAPHDPTDLRSFFPKNTRHARLKVVRPRQSRAFAMKVPMTAMEWYSPAAI